MESKVHLNGTKDNFKKLIGTIRSISEEAIFHFVEEHLYIKCFDKSQTAFLELTAKKDYFQDFRIEVPIEIGMNVNRTFTIIETCGEKISMSINDGIFIASEDQFNINAFIPHILIYEEGLNVPIENYSTSAILKVKDFKSNISNLLKFSEFVEISTQEKLTIMAYGSLGEKIIIGVQVDPKSNLNQKDKAIIVKADVINKLLLNFDELRNIKLNMDESLNSIELIYQEDNLYVRSLFARTISEDL